MSQSHFKGAAIQPKVKLHLILGLEILALFYLRITQFDISENTPQINEKEI